MLQSLLADRFRLTYRIETKEAPVYFLRKSEQPHLAPAKDETAFPWVGGPSGGRIMGDGIAGTNATIELLAKRLSPISTASLSTKPDSPARSISASIMRETPREKNAPT
jgi:uncharacterized protein (TIGR03435 family)